jgi:hypothetical protein
MRRIIARFHPQAWQNDYAVPTDPEGETEFDVTAEVLALGKDAALELRDDQFNTDALRFAASAPQWVQNWTGPFYIEVQSAIAQLFDGEESHE